MVKGDRPEAFEDDADETEDIFFDKVMTVRFSEKQIAAIRKRARHVGLKPGTYIRVRILEDLDWEKEEGSS